MGEIGSNTGRVDDIVECELVNEGRGLEEQGQWLGLSELRFMATLAPAYLSNTSRGACNDCLDHFVEKCSSRSSKEG